MEAEATGQLWALTDGSAYQEGQATQAARVDYAAERLRLLYVGITRARRELILAWNTGKGEQVEARPMAALRGWWEQERTKR
jgi:DNA helicase II / ATP-dependent DNA helicase PcrA